MFAEKGEKKPAAMAMNTMNCFIRLENIVYGGPELTVRDNSTSPGGPFSTSLSSLLGWLNSGLCSSYSSRWCCVDVRLLAGSRTPPAPRPLAPATANSLA